MNETEDAVSSAIECPTNLLGSYITLYNEFCEAEREEVHIDLELTMVMHEQSKGGKMFSECGATDTSQESTDV